MKVKYEVASEKYRNNGGVWELYDTPQHVAMYNTYEEAVRACGPFKRNLPTPEGFERIEVHTLYELYIDENGDAINVIETAYKTIQIID